MKRVTLVALGLVVVTALPSTAAAQATPAVPAGVRGEILRQFDDAANKLVRLAEAMPAEKYSWRPGAGVRPVSAVFMHVAGTTYYVLPAVGTQVQSPLPPAADTGVTSKAQVLDHMKRSFEQVRTCIRGLSDADLDKATSFFGMQTTYRNVLLLTATHAHEHLGQMIAYSRMNGVVPPWSMAGN